VGVGGFVVWGWVFWCWGGGVGCCGTCSMASPCWNVGAINAGGFPLVLSSPAMPATLVGVSPHGAFTHSFPKTIGATS